MSGKKRMVVQVGKGAVGRKTAKGGTGLTRGATLLFAVAGALSVANIYYAQPLLDAMAADFGISPAAIGMVVTVTQIGYALGLIFIVPFGDLIDRRRLIVGQAVLSAIALTIVAFAPTGVVFLAAMATVGVLAVVVQVLVAFAATLAEASERGKTVGIVTSGVVIGILLARFVSGILADIGGWRSVYLTSALVSLSMAVLLHRVLPQHTGSKTSASYASLLHSVPALFIQEPLLRVRTVLAMLIFATFSTFWTSMALALRAPPLSLSHTEVGLFGLVGVAGALAASGAGRLADRGLGQWTTGVSLVLMLVAWGPIALLHASLAALIGGVMVLDLAIQAVHVTNQSIIFTVRPEARSRLVGGYMVFYSVGSAIGSIASTMIYASAGWLGVCALGTAFRMIALAFWVATRGIGRKYMEPSQSPAASARPAA